jgi:Fe-S-cluster containining protein
MPSPCATCNRGCCQRYTVGVSGYDVQVIAQGLDLAPDQFLQAVAEPGTCGFRLARDGPAYQLALAKRPTGAEHAPCIFLIELPDGSGRCGIYPLRPLICQSYPAYTRQGHVGRRDDVLCPDQAWRDGALDHPAWYERLAQYAAEFDIYELAVTRWNYHVQHGPPAPARDLQAYLSYLAQLYVQLEPVRAQVSDWPTLCAAWDACLDRGGRPLRADCPELRPWQEVIDVIRATVGASLQTELDQQLLAEIDEWEAGAET